MLVYLQSHKAINRIPHYFNTNHSNNLEQPSKNVASRAGTFKK